MPSPEPSPATTLPAELPVASPRPGLLGTTGACLGLAIAAVLPFFGFDGWPNNHEGLSLFERAEGFRRAFAAGDAFPLWTPFCHNGHGSPWPFFYHRLFNTVSGGLAWVLGSTYRGVQLALVALLFVGALGAAASARRLGASRAVQVLAAFLLCFSPYTFFDWLVRGAAAELSAMMLYPWLLWACLRLRSEGRGGVSAGLVLVLLFYAHTVMFLYALPTFALALGFMLARHGWRRTLAATGQAALGVLVLCAPYALLMVRLGRHFNTGALGIFSPEREYVPLVRYLWDSEFHWGEQWKGNTPELGPALLGGLAVLTLGALVSRDERLRDRCRVLAFPGLAAAFYALLQVPLSAPFYRAVPFARLLQFPWRLVGFLTVLLVLVWAVLLEDALRREGWRRRLALAGVGLSVGAGLVLGWKATHPRYDTEPRAFIESHLARLDRPWSAFEYVPQSVLRAGFIAPPMPFLSARGCERMTAEPALALEGPLHFERITLTVSSPEGCVVHFNQYLTPFLATEADGPVRFVPTNVGTLAIQLPPDEHRVTLRRRGFLELLLREFQPPDT